MPDGGIELRRGKSRTGGRKKSGLHVNTRNTCCEEHNWIYDNLVTHMAYAGPISALYFRTIVSLVREGRTDWGVASSRVGGQQNATLLSGGSKLSNWRPRYEDREWDYGVTIRQNLRRSVCMS